MTLRLTPSEIVKATGGRRLTGYALSMIEAISTDSRTTTPGSIFVPLQGKRHDGHRFIESALNKGAEAAFISRSSGLAPALTRNFPRKNLVEVQDPLAALCDIARFWRQKLRIPVVAVAGGSEKTIIRELVRDLAGEALNVYTNTPENSSAAGLALSIAGLDARFKAAIFELGTADRDALKRLTLMCDPTAALITNAGAPPLSTKALSQLRVLFHCLPRGATAIFGSGTRPPAALVKASMARIITFGPRGETVFARNLRQDVKGRAAFDLCIGQEQAGVRMRLCGAVTLSAALGATAAAHVLGLDIADIAAGLESAAADTARSEK